MKGLGDGAIRGWSGPASLPPPHLVPRRARTAGASRSQGVCSHLLLSAELVVLSACQMGQGEDLVAEGIAGLTRALQYARSIVASSCSAADQSTPAPMAALRRGLHQGLAMGVALRWQANRSEWSGRMAGW